MSSNQGAPTSLSDELRAMSMAPSTHPAWSVQDALRRAVAAIDAQDGALRDIIDTLQMGRGGGPIGPLTPTPEHKINAAVRIARAARRANATNWKPADGAR